LHTVSISRKREPIVGSLAIQIDVYPPDRRRRDLDNILKALLDSLSHAGVIEDDSLFDRILLVRREVMPGGQIILQISQQEKET
jgi:crossover junction endodeoxyribonuclease RusA